MPPPQCYLPQSDPQSVRKTSWECGEICGTGQGGKAGQMCGDCSQHIVEVSGVNWVSCSLSISLIFCNTVLVKIHSILTRITMLQNKVSTINSPSTIATIKGTQ